MALIDNLAAYFKLDETSGTRNDSIGTNHLTDINTVGSVGGKISNAALIVQANNEYLMVADNAALSLGASDLSVVGWFYFVTKTFSNGLLGKGNASVFEYSLHYAGSDLLRWSVYTPSVGSSTATMTISSIGTGVWFFVAATWVSATRIASASFNDGTVVSGAAASGTGGADTAADFTIGALPGNQAYSWDGYIDEVGIWKRVLTATEITQLYNGGAGMTLPPPQSQAPRSMHRNRLARV